MENHMEFAVSLAKEAGSIMLQNFGLGMKRQWKSDNSPVTETDMRINEIVVAKVKEYFPGHSIFGEELSHSVSGSMFTWVCDPIDGTVPYSTNIPIATFSLALVENGVPCIGVIYDPFSSRLFTAEKSKGAFLNGVKIEVSNRSSINQAYVDIESREGFALMATLSKYGAKVTKLYCITCPGSLVACGEFDAAIFHRGRAWDIAALKVIVEEAGGIVTDINGDEQRYDGAINGGIICNKEMHASLLGIIREVT